ncbi:ferredoxin [Shewanella frigidimarina]|nr:ferredoxin [Shewanella frigidimarina]
MVYKVDPALLCTECVDHYDKPTCASVCPIDCIDPDPKHVESHDALLLKYSALTGNV